MVQLIRDYENGIITVVGSVKYDDSGDFLTRMDKLQKAIDVLKEDVRQTLVDEWIEVSESIDQFGSRAEDYEVWEEEWEEEQRLDEEGADYWDGDDSEKGQ